MLMDALAKLLTEKEFEEISVHEIAEAATLNRATFYLHYPDKNALLLAMTEARFRDLVERRGISFTDCDRALRGIALGVCDYLTEITDCPVKAGSIPLEGSVIPVVEAIFMEGLSHHESAAGLDAALVATTAAWAIFGAARRWFQEPHRIPAEKMASKIEAIVKPIFLSASDPKNAAGRGLPAASKQKPRAART
jgi:AcrR family transcriptional regulator